MKSRQTQERIFTLDLHGLPAEQAIVKLRDAIDRCFYYRYNRIRVIHGNGSGKLMEMTIAEATKNQLVKSVGACIIECGYTDLILEDLDSDINK
jgi:DNA-nicking Smr family endonuclease